MYTTHDRINDAQNESACWKPAKIFSIRYCFTIITMIIIIYIIYIHIYIYISLFLIYFLRHRSGLILHHEYQYIHTKQRRVFTYIYISYLSISTLIYIYIYMNEYYLLQSQSIFRTQAVYIGCGRTVWPDFSFLQAAVLHLLAGCQLINMTTLHES